MAHDVSEWESSGHRSGACDISKVLIPQADKNFVSGWRALCRGFCGEFMIRRKIWLHYLAMRLTVEVLAVFGSAALIGHWIVQTSR